MGDDKKSSNYTIVNSKVIPEAGDPVIKIDWRIYTKKSGETFNKRFNC